MTRNFEANVDKLDDVIAFLDEMVADINPNFRQLKKLELALEEAFVNVALYAYPEGNGDVKIDINIDDKDRSVNIVLTDSGLPFDPLSEKDPDVTLPSDKRKIGGLGIFLVKSVTDEQHYEYRDSKNILTFKKNITD